MGEPGAWLGLPWCSDVKNLPAMQEIWVRSLGSGRSPGEGSGNPLQYSGLENSMERGALWALVHEVAEFDMTERLILPHFGWHRCQWLTVQEVKRHHHHH